MMEAIGEFDELVGIYSCTVTTGTEGEKIETFTLLHTVYARARMNVDESLANDNQSQTHSVNFTMYKLPIDTRSRIKWRGRWYGIESINPIGRLSRIMEVEALSI